MNAAIYKYIIHRLKEIFKTATEFVFKNNILKVYNSNFTTVVEKLENEMTVLTIVNFVNCNLKLPLILQI